MPPDIYNDSFFQNCPPSLNLYFWLVILQLFYLLPSFYIEYRIFHSMMDFRKFRMKPSFDNLFFFILLLDNILKFLLFLVDFATNRVPQTGLLTPFLSHINPVVWLSALYFLFHYLQYACFYSSFSLALLRFIAVSFPLRLDELFRLIGPFVLILILVFPLGTSFFLIPAYAYFSHGLAVDCSVNIDYVRVFPAFKSSVCLTYVSVTLSALGLLCGFLTLFRMKAIFKARAPGQKRRTELSLSLTTATSFACLGVNAAMLYIFLRGGGGTGLPLTVIFTVRPFLFDLMHFLPLWCFFLSHPVFRDQAKTSTTAVLSLSDPKLRC